MPPRTLGAEEEFHLVDLKTRRLTARAPELLAELSGHYVAELQRCVVEMNTRVVDSLDGLRGELVDHRRVLVDTAAELGMGVVAAGAVPLSVPAEMQVTQDAALPANARRLPTAGARAADLRHPGACRRRRPRRGRRGRPPGGGVPAHSARAVGQLAVRVRRLGHRLFEHAHAGLAALADDRPGRPSAIGRRIRPAGQATWWPAASSPTPGWSTSTSDRRTRAPTLELRVCDSCPSVDTIVLIAGLFRASGRARGRRGAGRHSPATILSPALGPGRAVAGRPVGAGGRPRRRQRPGQPAGRPRWSPSWSTRYARNWRTAGTGTSSAS